MALDVTGNVSVTTKKNIIRSSSGYQDNFFLELMKAANVSKAHLTVDATSATIGVAQASPANQKKPITIVVYPTSKFLKQNVEIIKILISNDFFF